MTLASKAKAYGHHSASHDLIEARPDGCIYYMEARPYHPVREIL
jgi:hypothetical protein